MTVTHETRVVPTEQRVTVLHCDRADCPSESAMSPLDLVIALPKGWVIVSVGNGTGPCVDRHLCGWDCMLLYGRNQATLARREARKLARRAARAAQQPLKGSV